MSASFTFCWSIRSVWRCSNQSKFRKRASVVLSNSVNNRRLFPRRRHIVFLQLTTLSEAEMNQNPLFLDQYSSSENVRIINKVARKVSFKCRSPWILWSFEIKWVISWNNYLHDFAEFLREISTFAFTWYPTLDISLCETMCETFFVCTG